MRILKRGGKIFFLEAPAETLISRLEGDTERPLLAGGAAKRVNELLPMRTPLYLAAADCVIHTAGLTPTEIAKKILAQCGADFSADAKN